MPNSDAPLNTAARQEGISPGLRVLHLEDNTLDRELIQDWVCRHNSPTHFIDAASEADFVEALAHETFDIILSDNALPGFNGLRALHLAREKFPYTPFIFVTGSMGEEAAIETMKKGATDYVLKDRLIRLVPAIQRAVRDAEHEERARKTEEKIREQAALLDQAQDAILVIDPQDRIMYWNKGAERVYGWKSDLVIGHEAASLLSTNVGKYQKAKATLIEKGSWTGELVAANRGGNELVIESRWTLVRDEQGRPKSVLMIDTDITEKKALETKFLRAQRLDSIGALAGGIAHDLNNALAPVLMGVDLARTSTDEDSRNKLLDVIETGAERATGLVKQILSFARGSGSQISTVDLNQLLDDIRKMIQETFPKDIRLSLRNSERPLWTVQGDVTELHQIVMNLCVNARDAMPQGGTLSLATRNVNLDEKSASSFGADPGTYVMISVGDTGTGIPVEVLPRIFEPFFSTKKADKGTGLGLATVAEIVRRYKGFMDLQTEAGKGTEFRVHFPASVETELAENRVGLDAGPEGKGELILVVNDEATLLELTTASLETFGYRVVAVQNGVQGLARFNEQKEEFKLVICEINAPHGDADYAIGVIRKLKPEMPVLKVVTFNEASTNYRENMSRRIKQLEKPYTLEQLLAAVDSAVYPSANVVTFRE